MEKELGWIRPILALLHLSIVTSAPSTTLNPCFTALWRTWTTWICLTLIRPLIRSKPTPLRRSLDAAQPSLKVRENDMIIVDATLTYMMKSLGSFGNSYTFPHFRITINSLNPWNITPVTVRIVVWLKASKINVNIFSSHTLTRICKIVLLPFYHSASWGLNLFIERISILWTRIGCFYSSLGLCNYFLCNKSLVF